LRIKDERAKFGAERLALRLKPGLKQPGIRQIGKSTSYL